MASGAIARGVLPAWPASGMLSTSTEVALPATTLMRALPPCSTVGWLGWPSFSVSSPATCVGTRWLATPPSSCSMYFCGGSRGRWAAVESDSSSNGSMVTWSALGLGFGSVVRGRVRGRGRGRVRGMVRGRVRGRVGVGDRVGARE